MDRFKINPSSMSGGRLIDTLPAGSGLTTEALASLAAKLTLEAFNVFNASFGEITARASRRFAERDWAGGRNDASDRLDLYEQTLDRVAEQLEEALGPGVREQATWAMARKPFALLVGHRYDIDRAETFFNSVTRRMLHTVGVNREVEFFFLHPKASSPAGEESAYRSYTVSDDTTKLVRDIFLDLPLLVNYADVDRDAALVAHEIDLVLWPIVGAGAPFRIDVVRAPFFRNKEAYIVGRFVADARTIPLVIPLVHGERGVFADTVLLHDSDVGILFSFAYSYFFVDLERHDALITFLRSILPGADLAELYTSLGYNRHGKTEFYRGLHRYVHVSREQFVIAPGKEGAVMIAFTLPNYNFVLKVIKDTPCFLRSSHDTPKVISNAQVRRQYAYVSHRDRAGRMVDTQEFENLRFKKKRFSGVLLDELTRAATKNVTITDDYVILRHAYVQRRVLPLPIFFREEKDSEVIRRVLLDFGYFLKDIAASGVFPCDLFNTWNYGVTPWKRVVLFDYDDVLPIEQIRFREKPKPRDELEEMGLEEEWIVATEEDFFMDEIDRFSGIPYPLRGIFKSVHGDLYTLGFWNSLTGRLRNGEVFDVVPYPRERRFSYAPSQSPNVNNR